MQDAICPAFLLRIEIDYSILGIDISLALRWFDLRVVGSTFLFGTDDVIYFFMFYIVFFHCNEIAKVN